MEGLDLEEDGDPGKEEDVVGFDFMRNSICQILKSLFGESRFLGDEFFDERIIGVEFGVNVEMPEDGVKKGVVRYLRNGPGEMGGAGEVIGFFF